MEANDLLGRMEATMVHEKLFTHAFESDQFVDAIAVQPRSATDNGNHAPLIAVAFSALESNLWGGGVAILDGTSGQQLGVLRIATGVSTIAWVDEQHDILALGCDNGDVQFMRVSKGEDGIAFERHAEPTAETFSGHDDIVTGVAVSAMQPNIVASASWDLQVKLWDTVDPSKALNTLDGHTNLIWDISANATVPHIWATASQDATVQVWDDRLFTQSPASSLSTSAYTALSVDWEKTECHTLAAGLEDGSVVVFDIRNPQSPLKRMVLHKGGVHCVKYSPFDAHVLAVGSDDASASVIFGTASHEPIVHKVATKTGESHGDYVRALEWYKAPRTQLLTGSWDHNVRSWNVSPSAWPWLHQAVIRGGAGAGGGSLLTSEHSGTASERSQPSAPRMPSS